jgi:hypothetical protein
MTGNGEKKISFVLDGSGTNASVSPIQFFNSKITHLGVLR